MHFNIGRELNRCIVNCDTKWRQCRCNYLAKCTKSLQCAQCRALYPPQVAIFSECTSANCTVVFSKYTLPTVTFPKVGKVFSSNSQTFSNKTLLSKRFLVLSLHFLQDQVK